MTAAIANQERVQELVKEIELNRDLYWSGEGDPVPDIVYDAYIEELRVLDSEHELLTKVENPIDITADNTIKHDTPMLSLEKVYSLEDLLSWCTKVARNTVERFSISPKFDGMAGCHYKGKGILATRGDGHYGENITNKIPLIDFGQEDKDKVFGKSQNKVYGEIIIKKSDFKSCTLTRKDGSKFKTERNLVAGVMNPSRKDMDEIKDKVTITFVQHNSMNTICTTDMIKEKWDDIVEEIKSIDYPIDGIVIKLQDTKYGKTLGVTSHHPRHSIAFKFPDENKMCKVLTIDWQSGKRKITPVCYIEPTIIDGVTIKKITLHNAKNVLDMDLQEGDYVSVVRRGGVIPYIENSIPGEVRAGKPVIEECPACKDPVFYEEPELVCKNPICDGSIKKKLVTVAKILDIDYMSDSTVSKIVDYFNGEVNNVADLLRLDYNDFLELDGFGDRSSTKLSDNIEKVRRGVEDWKILACLCLNGIGRSLSKQMLAQVTMDELRSLSEGELEEFDNMGVERASVLFNGLHDNCEVIDDICLNIANVIETKVEISQNTNAQSKPKTICFSGTFNKPKKYYQDLATKSGMSVEGSVTKKLDYLITAGPSTSKVTKARKYGVTILNEEEFINWV
jgi:DNA ligase (NAD+)